MAVVRCSTAHLAMIALHGRDVGVNVRLVGSGAGLRSNSRLRWHVGVDVHDDLESGRVQ